MIIQDCESMEPEELSEVGRLFDEAWAALSGNGGAKNPELRTALASILLRLAHRRELGPDKMKAAALSILQGEPEADLSATQRCCPMNPAVKFSHVTNVGPSQPGI